MGFHSRNKLNIGEDINICKKRIVISEGRSFDIISKFIVVLIAFGFVIDFFLNMGLISWHDVSFMDYTDKEAQLGNQQNKFNFRNSLISSKFDSGNIHSVSQAFPYEYEIKVGGETNCNFRRWFYFSIKNIKQPAILTFFISNITFDQQLLDHGVVPVYKSASSGKIWSRIQDKTRIRRVDQNEIEIEFSYQYEPSMDGETFFALSYPWSYSEDQEFYADLVSMHGTQNDTFLERQTLSKTKNGNNLDVVLISSKQNLNETNRKNIGGINLPALDSNKSILIIASRIHGFEVLGSRAMSQVSKVLMDDSKESQELRNRFLIVLIPMMNPDGVQNGYNLFDAFGNDFEEVFASSSKDNSTEAFQIKSMISSFSSEKLLSGILILRSSQDEDTLQLSTPPLTKSNSRANLIFSMELADFFENYDAENHVKEKESNLLKQLSILTNDGLMMELNIPSMKSSRSSKNKVTNIDNETIVRGITASQGSLEIRQIVTKIIRSLHSSFKLGRSQANKSKKEEEKQLNLLYRSIKKLTGS